MHSMLTRWTRRYVRTALITTVTIISLIAALLRRHHLRRDHVLAPELVHYSSSFAAGNRHILPSEDADSMCRNHGFPYYAKHRKVYDLVLFSTELDWLEIRLHTLSPYVDYFVIIESSTTFTSKPKPLHLKSNWDRFKEFHDQIIHRVVDDQIAGGRIWDHEDFFRNSLLHEVFPGLVGTPQEARRGDVLVVSDMDEILRPGTALVLRYCDFPARLTLRSQFYYYSFQWRHRGLEWAHPDATVYGGSPANSISPNDLRQGLLGPGWAAFAALRRWWDRGTLWNAGWHCSSCFSTIAEMQTKMHSFSHQGFNTDDNRDAKNMIDRVRNGLDLFAREGELYDRVEANQDVPEYILREYQEHGRFKYLLDRDDNHTAFED